MSHTKNKLTFKLIYVLIAVVFIYGLGLAFAGDIGENRFTFSDGEELKKGLFATDPFNEVAESWFEWTITYTDGTTEVGRTTKNQASIIPLTLVKSVENPSIISRAEFIMYTDFSRIGKNICIGTPATKITQQVFLNGSPINVLKQLQQYNEIDERNILKGSGVSITPSFFEGQLLINNKGLKSGDVIKVVIDGSGRFDLAETDIHTGECPLDFKYRYDGFIEGLHAEYELIYADPLDLATGSFPNKQTEIDDPVIVDQCVNGKCGPVIVSTPECPTGQIYDIKTFSCIDNPCPEGQEKNSFGFCVDKIPDQGLCIQVFDPVCGSDGKTYSNSCIAQSFGATIVSEGICEAKDNQMIENPFTDDPNPNGTDGIVGTCDTELFDCSEDSQDVQDFVDQIRENEFRFNSFEFIMLIIIGIIIIAIILSRLVKK